MKQKAVLILLFVSIVILASSLSFGLLSPLISRMEIQNTLLTKYGVTSPEQFTKLTGLTLKTPSIPDFSVIAYTLNGVGMMLFMCFSLLGKHLNPRKSLILKIFLFGLFIGLLLGSGATYVTVKAATPTYTIDPEGLLPKAYDYIIYVSGSTYYRIDGADSTVTSGTDDDTLIQYALNQTKSVIIKAGSYSASVTVKGGRLIIEKGATGITYTVDSSATAFIEDWNSGKTEYYASGTLRARFDYASGKFWWNGQNSTDILKYPEQPVSYVIFKSGSTYYAKNVSSGKVEYSGTDFWTVVSNAINTTYNANGGGKIAIRAGTYLVSKTIVMQENIILEGEGSGTDTYNTTNPGSLGSTILRYTGTSGSMFKGVNDPNHTDGLGFIGFTIDMNGKGSYGIDLTACRRAYLERLFVINGTTHGIYVAGVTGGNSAHQVVMYSVISAYNGGDGFRFTSEEGKAPNEALLVGCRAYYNTGNGFYMDSGHGVIIGGESSGNAIGLYLEGDRMTVLGFRAEGDTTAVNITANCDKPFIIGLHAIGTVINNQPNAILQDSAVMYIPTLYASIIYGDIDGDNYLDISGLRESANAVAIRFRTKNSAGNLQNRMTITGYTDSPVINILSILDLNNNTLREVKFFTSQPSVSDLDDYEVAFGLLADGTAQIYLRRGTTIYYWNATGSYP